MTSETIFIVSVLLPLSAVFIYWGYRNFRHGWAEGFHMDHVVPADSVQGQTMADADGELQQQQQQQHQQELTEKRKRVLDLVFPRRPVGTEGKTVFVYDAELKTYVLHNNPDSVVSFSCSICLEDFDAKSLIVTANCSHSYHRHCIVSWAKEHSDCPNCRAGMWDPIYFSSMIDQQK